MEPAFGIDEIVFNYLINLSVDDLKEQCFRNKKWLNICTNTFFWESKFEHDDLPYLVIEPPKTIGEWISEYQRTANAVDTTNKILYIFKHESQNDKNLSMIILLMSLLPQKLLNADIDNVISNPRKYEDVTIIFQYKNQKYTITYLAYDEDKGKYDEVIADSSLLELKSFLILSLYHDSSTVILDQYLENFLPPFVVPINDRIAENRLRLLKQFRDL